MTDRFEPKRSTVYFIGAGPGAPDLITLRGKRIIDSAASVIYAGSLVNPALFEDYDGPLYDSSTLHLDEIISLMNKTVQSGGHVARVHTGDPSLYGAIKEQMVRLQAVHINYEVVPGVSSAFGAAAALAAELTVPEVTQSVIITRREGRTPVPERERLADLGSHGCTMLIFLSVGMMNEVVRELRSGGYTKNTPVTVVMKATWPDEKIVRGTLADIAAKVDAAGIVKTALICVGDAFSENPFSTRSKLYDKSFSHGVRDGGADTGAGDR